MQPHAGGHNAARAESSVDATRFHGCHHHALCCISILWGVNLVCLQLPVICSLLAFEGCSLVPSTCSTWVCGAVRRLPLRQYALLCSAQYIPRIRTPTLLLAATDDLFVWCIPACRSEAGLGQAPALHDLQHCVSCTLPPGSACWVRVRTGPGLAVCRVPALHVQSAAEIRLRQLVLATEESSPVERRMCLHRRMPGESCLQHAGFAGGG